MLRSSASTSQRGYYVPPVEDEYDDDEVNVYEDAPVIEGDFTLRAVLVGLGVGVLLAMSNMYFGLQTGGWCLLTQLTTGWVSMMSLQSALLGFAVFKLPGLMPKLFPNSRPLTAQENVVLQTTAVATGTMPLAAGFVGIIPALAMMNEEEDGRGPIVLSYTSLVLWSLGVAFFGVFLAVPLRRQVIVKEKLVFPSGTATAQLIALLHKQPPLQGLNPSAAAYTRVPQGDDAVSRKPAGALNGSGWWALGGSFAASALMTVSDVSGAS